MPIKVRDLAKELEVTNEAVLEQLHKLYVDAEDKNSKVGDKIAGLVRIKLGGSIAAKKVTKAKTKPVPPARVKAKTGKGKGEAEEKPEGKVEDKEKGKRKKKKEKTPIEEKSRAKSKEKEEGKRKKEKVVEAEKEPEIEEEKAKEKAAEKKNQEAKREAEEKVEEKKKPRKEEIVIKKETFAKPGITIKKPKKGVKRPIVEIIEKGQKPGAKFKKTLKGGKPGPVVQAKRTFGLVPKEVPARKIPQKLQIQVPTNIRTLAPHINVKPNMVIQYLMGQGAFVNINQDLEEDVVRDVMEHFGYELELHRTVEAMEKELMAEHDEGPEGLKAPVESRCPVVTFMGHVDHGKTSLLDYIRDTMVTKGEKGGITQHIGAYKVETSGGSVTFLDTPGHAAFTAMRARGANATDVVVLVVAADDGVMPQTREAIDHARAAKVPIVVAINKCDLPNANPDRVKRELHQENILSEDMGGKTIMVEVSAKTGEGVDKLVEMLMLESEMLELKATPRIRARGVVLEGRKTPGQGVIVTLLVQNGTLRSGDIVLCGSYYGKIKAMMNDRRERVEEASPATPVEILGLQGVPKAGEEFFVVKDEKKARTLSLLKQSESRKRGMAGSQRVTLEDLHSRIVEGSMKELTMVLKGDVQGSVEALKQSLEELATDEVKVNIIHLAVGNINESDVMLAMVSNAVIIGFNVKADTRAEEISKSEKIDIRVYDIIYEAIADVRAGMEGLLEPEEREAFQGSAQVRAVFANSKVGKVAGCMVTKGTISRKDRVRVKRGQEIIHEGVIDSLKRFKDDVKDAKEGFECGISIKGFRNIRENDIIEAFTIEKIARRLEK